MNAVKMCQTQWILLESPLRDFVVLLLPFASSTRLAFFSSFPQLPKQNKKSFFPRF
jgi:hypothetical protein